MESLVRPPRRRLHAAHKGLRRPPPAPATPFYFSFPPTQSTSEPPSLFAHTPPPPAMASRSPSRVSSGFSISTPPFGESNGPLVLRMNCELPAVARGSSHDSFAILVHAKAPGAAAVREAWIAVACAHPDVHVRAVKSSGRRRHEGLVLVASGRGALVHVGELRTGQERRFLMFVNVPSVAHDDDGEVTRLVRVTCAYRDVMTGKTTVVAGEDAVVRRPAQVTSQEDQKPSVEVQMERFRVQAAAGPFATPAMRALKADMVDLSKTYVDTGDSSTRATMVMPNNGIGSSWTTSRSNAK